LTKPSAAPGFAKEIMNCEPDSKCDASTAMQTNVLDYLLCSGNVGTGHNLSLSDFSIQTYEWNAVSIKKQRLFERPFLVYPFYFSLYTIVNPFASL